MADSLPSPTPFKLPEDVHLLARLRDQLDDYLGTLERNTDSINDWLNQNQNDIIVRHHQLVRAITHDKDEAAAQDAFKNLGDMTGFILNLQDFESLATAQFGKDSQIAKAIAKAPRGFPERILETLPEIKIPEDGEEVDPVAIVPVANTQAAEEETQKKGFWSSVGGWFKGGPDPEEEAREKEASIRRHWRNVRSELISLQSERHYYIDSFMDWVGENLAPETPDSLSAGLMEKYQDPQYVINLAQRDYAEVNEGKTKRLSEQSLDYSRIARTFDEQRIGEFITFLPNLFPKTETPESKQLKTLLLTDYRVASFAELALTQVKDRKDQLALLSAALTHETRFEVAGLKTGAQIFEKVLGQTLEAKPLDSAALQITLEKLRRQEKEVTGLLDLSQANKTVFKRIAARFGDDFAAVEKATGHVYAGLSVDSSKLHKSVIGLAKAAAAQDVKQAATLLGKVQSQNAGHAFMAMWHLSYPEKSIVATLQETAKDNKELSWVMDNALKAGILDELKGARNAATGRTDNIIRFINQTIVPSLATDDSFSLDTTRALIAHGFANGGLITMRSAATKKDGWLAAIVESDKLDSKTKLKWIAAMLEPFNSDVLKANVLHDAANNSSNKATRQILDDMEQTFVGHNIRLGDNKILTNLDRIANIWYNPEPKTLRFTVNGTGHTLLEDISPALARETLALLQRKGTFNSEYDGIFNPDNIDRVVSGAQGPKISWYRHTGDLNVTQQELKALHQRADFLHEDDKKTGHTFSINQKSVALLQPLEDGTHLLVDRYGSVLILEGNIRLQAQKPLLDLGGVFFNPENASILSLNTEKNSIEFRTESKEFDDFLDKAAPGEYFYNVPLPSAAAVKQVEKAVKAEGAIASPGGSLDNLYFNLAALGYMRYDDEGETGFRCHKYGPARKPGFINTEADLAQAVFDGLAKKDDLFKIQNILTHKSVIDDAYYNADSELFYLVIGQDVQSVPCDEETAYKALKALSKEPGFEVVGANYIQNPAKPGTGIVEMPADVINLSRATLLSYSEAQQKTYVTADSDKFHISLDRAPSQELFDKLELAGLADARKATQSTAWVQDLKGTFATLTSTSVKVTPSLTEMTPAYLLKQASGAGEETRALPSLEHDFAIAAKPLKTNDNLHYPVRRSRAPVARAAR